MNKIIAFCAVLLLFACAAPLEYDRAKFSINPDVKFSAINSNSNIRERDGQVVAQVMGISAKNQAVYYKVEWFDANGMNISSSLSAWKKVNLFKNSEFIWKAVAPSKRASAYRIYITDDVGNGIIE